MTKTHSWTIVSGLCKCGHSYEDHHLGIIMNETTLKELPKDHPPFVPGECEYYGSNEMGGLGPNGEEHCNQYRDIYL